MTREQTIQRFIELERKKAEVKQYHEDLQNALKAVIKEIGIGSYFQDEMGIVYKTTIPEGRYIHYEAFSYTRTKRTDEKRGDLSVKEAEEAGFVINKG